MLNNKIQIIIPMSGFGERFRRAGYSIPKPLIEIDGKPIIAHVIDMFPGETDFIFICNEDHLAASHYNMESLLRTFCPSGKIVSIPAHPYGPIHAVLQAVNDIDLTRPTIVNYCDFTCYWDWHHFKKWVHTSQCSGAIPAYRGFHPHTLGTTHYAYIREKEGWLLGIQEKKPFTETRMNEYASSGTYYFSSGELMRDAFQETIKKDLHVNGEYYVSLAYKILLTHHHPIAVYDLQHFMQWGTPEDVADYRNWSAIFHHLHQPRPTISPVGTVIIPMAGLGQRFIQEGYTTTKPLIPVSGQPMVVQAIHDLPAAKNTVFVLRGDMLGYENIVNTLLEKYPNAIIETIPHVTEGQACTALMGLDALAKKYDEETAGPIIFGACDNGALYDPTKLALLMQDENTDVIVWGVRGHTHAIRNPHMYGWIQSENDLINHISVKKPLLSPSSDPIVLGTFIFKRASDFRRSVARMIARDCKINGEFYIDTCINDAIALDLRCTLFEVQHYISWGTPNDLRTFEYWQSCFHKWESHSYSLSLDSRLPHIAQETLKKCYQATFPKQLEPL